MKITRLFLPLAATLVTVACAKDFLEVVSPTQIADDIFWSQESDAVISLGAGAALGSLVHRTAVVDVNVQDGEAESMWRLSVVPSDVATSIDQLDDLLLVCHYDVRPIAN